MHTDFYIASRYRNKDIVLELAEKIRSKGKTVYVFLESNASLNNVANLETDPEEAMKKFEAIENWKEDPKVKEVFESDMNAIKNADTLLLLLPAGKSAHIEAGVAHGLGKKLILIGEQKETESLYLIFSEHYQTIDDFIGFI